MANFIELTDKAGKIAMYNTSIIKFVEVYNDKVAVKFMDHTEIFVSESYEAIKKQLLPQN